MPYIVALSINLCFALCTLRIIHKKSDSDILTNSQVLLNVLLVICTPLIYMGMYRTLELATQHLNRSTVSLMSLNCSTPMLPACVECFRSYKANKSPWLIVLPIINFICIIANYILILHG